MHLLNIFSVFLVVVISSQRRKSLTKKKIRDVQDNYTCVGGFKDDSCDVLTPAKTIVEPTPTIRIFIDAGSSGTRFYPEANLKCKVKDDTFKGDSLRDKKTTLKFLFTINTDATKSKSVFDEEKAKLFKTNFMK